MNKLSLILSAAFLLTAAFAAHSFAKPQSQTDSQSLPSDEDQFTAIAIVRNINTAEVGYRAKAKDDTLRNRFGTWSDLISSGVFDEMKPRTRMEPDVWPLITADGVQGYKLALIVSPDGQSYELALHDAKPENYLFSVFSDQTGIIYTGSPLR